MAVTKSRKGLYREAVLDGDQLAAWERDGFLVVPGAAEPDACEAVIERAEQIVAAFDPSTISVFSTREQTRTSDEYFLSSGGEVRCFFEEEAFGPDGALAVPKERAINKIGHAQHDLDPVYDAFSRTDTLAEIVDDLGVADPRLLQSMHIFKQPRIGGEVSCHQDATFLWTEPDSVVGLWFALRGRHARQRLPLGRTRGPPGPLRPRFVRAGATDADGTRFEPLDPTPLPNRARAVRSSRSRWRRAPSSSCTAGCPTGPARTGRSGRATPTRCTSSRAAPGTPRRNWLQRPPELALRGF